MSGFEGSFVGGQGVDPAAIMECKVCWYRYSPDKGDDTRAILPGTAFIDLPDDWSCPECSSPRDMFIVCSDTTRLQQADATTRSAISPDVWLVQLFKRIADGMPFSNPSLRVEASEFRLVAGEWLGVVVTPYSMALILVPDSEHPWPDQAEGEKILRTFPSGEYEFVCAACEDGFYASCALFSDMSTFASQEAALEVARAILVAIEYPAERLDGLERKAAFEGQRSTTSDTRETRSSRRSFLRAGL